MYQCFGHFSGFFLHHFVLARLATNLLIWPIRNDAKKLKNYFNAQFNFCMLVLNNKL